MAALAQSSALAAVASVPTASGAVASGSKPAQAKSLAFNGLKSASTSLQAASLTSEWSSKTVTNTARVQCMKVWEPYNNTKFETLSYLPPLTDTQIAAQIQYLLTNGWVPTIEFDKVGFVSGSVGQFSGYYDGRYWVMWKLPMFGCTDPAQVLQEINECKKLYPDCYIRVIGFDNVRQVQCAAFIAHKPSK